MFSDETENITTDERKVSRLLSDLPRAAAPSDFAIRVRSRIARESSAERPRFGLPLAVRYALGLGSVLAAFAVVAFVWNFTSSPAEVPPVVVAESTRPIESANTGSTQPVRIENTEQRNTVAVVRPSEANTVVTTLPESKTAAAISKTPSPTADETQKESIRVYPKGLNPNKPESRPKDIEERRAIPITELLSFFGVDAAVTDKGMRVDSVKANSSAERLGVRKGDVIISINDQPLRPDASFKDPVTVRGLRVMRDGQTINIALGGK